MNEVHIGARELDIRKCIFSEVSPFLKETHILGTKCGILYLGAFYKDELVTCAVFGKHHITNEGLVLSRWCVKENYTLSGALSKISKIALQETKESSIISWADLRFSEGKGYLSAGWTIDAVLEPDYFYYEPNKKKVIYKNQRRKSKAHTPEGMTESQHAKLDKLLTIWDCGKLRLVFKG